MDLAALTLKSTDLFKLAQDLLAADPQRPEPWLTVALCADDDAKALGIVDKAITLNSRHARSHLMRGELLLKLGKTEQASQAYYQANSSAEINFEVLCSDSRVVRQKLIILVETRKFLDFFYIFF